MRTLHIVDGESTGGTMRLAGLAKKNEILRWQDALYTGPVPAGLTLRQLSRLRSRFWTEGRSGKEFDKRDAALQKHGDFDEIVLWFGSGCTLCELSLLQLLDWFRQERVNASRLFRVTEEGGPLPAAGIIREYGNRRPVSSEQMQIAAGVWKALRAPSPVALARIAKSSADIDQGLQKAIRWLLAEYPSTQNGLSRLENELLCAVASHEGEKAAAVVASILIAGEYVGDQLLFDLLRNLITARCPLLRFSGTFKGRIESWKFNSAALMLTDVGRRVLDEDADHVALNGTDRWIGGAHLRGKKVRWRWDERQRRIVARQ